MLDQGTSTVLVSNEGVKQIITIDSRSSCCILQLGMSGAPWECTSVAPFGVMVDNLVVRGKQNVILQFGEVMFRHTYRVGKYPLQWQEYLRLII